MDLDGSVNLVGPPFLCCKREDILVKQVAILHFRPTEKYTKLFTRANPAPISKLPASPSTSSLPFSALTDFFLSVLDAGLLLPRGRPLTAVGGLHAMGQHSV